MNEKLISSKKISLMGMAFGWVIFMALSPPVNSAESSKGIPPELLTVRAVESECSGLDDQQPPTWERHDPSNIIKYKSKYLMWCTEHATGNPFLWCRIVLLSSVDGRHWEYEQIALDKRAEGAWDDGGVLTSYIVPYSGKYYMFYLGVDRSFKNSATDPKSLGYAVANSPYGPWEREKDNKILSPSGKAGTWDEISVDDPNVLRKGDQWLFYFKGRQKHAKWNETQIGLATSKSLTGPYEKIAQNPLFPGHALTVTKYKDGFIALPGESHKTILWSADGINFVEAAGLNHKSTGVYNPPDQEASAKGEPIQWFIDVVPPTDEKPRVLRRVDLIYPDN